MYSIVDISIRIWGMRRTSTPRIFTDRNICRYRSICVMSYQPNDLGEQSKVCIHTHIVDLPSDLYKTRDKPRRKIYSHGMLLTSG